MGGGTAWLDDRLAERARTADNPFRKPITSQSTADFAPKRVVARFRNPGNIESTRPLKFASGRKSTRTDQSQNQDRTLGRAGSGLVSSVRMVMGISGQPTRFTHTFGLGSISLAPFPTEWKSIIYAEQEGACVPRTLNPSHIARTSCEEKRRQLRTRGKPTAKKATNSRLRIPIVARRGIDPAERVCAKRVDSRCAATALENVRQTGTLDTTPVQPGVP